MKWIYLAIIVLSVADLLITSQVLASGGTELNPIAAWVIAQAGMVGAVALKASCVTLAICVIEVAREPHPVWATVATALAVILSLAPLVFAAVQAVML